MLLPKPGRPLFLFFLRPNSGAALYNASLRVPGELTFH
jgi:hypothetical protein